MAIFVLVHGARGGCYGFRKVRGPLREDHMIASNRSG